MALGDMDCRYSRKLLINFRPVLDGILVVSKREITGVAPGSSSLRGRRSNSP